MLTVSILLLISVTLTAVIGLLFGADTRRDPGDAEQVEYLSRWSDMKRLRKQGSVPVRIFSRVTTPAQSPLRQ